MEKKRMPAWLDNILAWGGAVFLTIGIGLLLMLLGCSEDLCSIACTIVYFAWFFVYDSLTGRKAIDDTSDSLYSDSWRSDSYSGGSYYGGDVSDILDTSGGWDLGDSGSGGGFMGDCGSPYTGRENMEYTDSRNQYDHELFMEDTEYDF